MKIIITTYFEKQMGKLTIAESVVVSHIRNYEKNPQSYINLGKFGEYIVCKDYLQGGGVRLMVLRQLENNYFPVSLVKKGSAKGKNIRKENVEELFINDIKKTLQDYEDQKFRIVEL